MRHGIFWVMSAAVELRTQLSIFTVRISRGNRDLINRFRPFTKFLSKVYCETVDRCRDSTLETKSFLSLVCVFGVVIKNVKCYIYKKAIRRSVYVYSQFGKTSVVCGFYNKKRDWNKTGVGCIVCWVTAANSIEMKPQMKRFRDAEFWVHRVKEECIYEMIIDLERELW